jgi:sugar/nucleoside kinase (ribokinase family)
LPAPPLWPGFARPGAVDVVGLGQISLDRVWVLDGALTAPPGPEPPELPSRPGGQVATALLALHRLGLRTAFLGAVGDDAAAEAALAPLRRAGVDCVGVKRVRGGRTRQALVRVERSSGERSVHPERDPRVALSPVDLDRGRIVRARALHVDTEDPEASAWAARAAHAAAIPVTLDAARPGPEADAVLPHVDFAIVSREFACPGGEDLEPALAALAARARRMAVVTLGSEGAVASERAGGATTACAGFAVRPRDTTGAGDVFHAGFLWALLQGWGLRDVLRAANAAAALSCRGEGAQGALPDRASLERVLGGAPVD